MSYKSFSAIFLSGLLFSTTKPLASDTFKLSEPFSFYCVDLNGTRYKTPSRFCYVAGDQLTFGKFKDYYMDMEKNKKFDMHFQNVKGGGGFAILLSEHQKNDSLLGEILPKNGFKDTFLDDFENILSKDEDNKVKTLLKTKDDVKNFTRKDIPFYVQNGGKVEKYTREEILRILESGEETGNEDDGGQPPKTFLKRYGFIILGVSGVAICAGTFFMLKIKKQKPSLTTALNSAKLKNLRSR